MHVVWFQYSFEDRPGGAAGGGGGGEGREKLPPTENVLNSLIKNNAFFETILEILVGMASVLPPGYGTGFQLSIIVQN